MSIHLDFNTDVVWKYNETLAPYSTYKIGGPAKLLTKVHSHQELKAALSFCYQEKLDVYLLGKGSNTLFDDQGFDGAVIVNAITGIARDKDVFEALAGTPFTYLGLHTAKLGYSGLEYAAGIPGSVGGAVYMNAGANQSEIKDVIVSVTFFDEYLNEQTLLKKDLQFKYRRSIFHDLQAVIISAKFQLKKDPDAKENQKKMLKKRKASQPLNQASCGCAYRNEPHFSAGAIIEKLGFKGTKVGGAMVSDRHANFIVNQGHATAQDVLTLMGQIEEKVFALTGCQLQRELKYVPFQRREK